MGDAVAATGTDAASRRPCAGLRPAHPALPLASPADAAPPAATPARSWTAPAGRPGSVSSRHGQPPKNLCSIAGYPVLYPIDSLRGHQLTPQVLPLKAEQLAPESKEPPEPALEKVDMSLVGFPA